MSESLANKERGVYGQRRTAGTALAWTTTVTAAACIAASIGLLPTWLVFAFKPLTTALIIAYAWKRGRETPGMRRYILAGLLLSLAGDVFLLWPKEGFLPGLVSFLLAHLAYIVAFCRPVRFAARPWVYLAYALVAGGILSLLWKDVPPALRVPVVAYVVCLAAMAAQAAVWWRSAPACISARWAALGGGLFMASDTLLAFNKFAAPLPLSALWILAPYWMAQWCIASALADAGETGEGLIHLGKY